MPQTSTQDRWVLAVYVLIRDPRGRVLMLRRSRTTKHFPGTWELPGGKPAPGENFAKTAELEVTEETGLYVVPNGVAGAMEGAVPGVRIAMLVMDGRTAETEITLSDEHDAHQWLPLAKMSTLNLRPGFDAFFAAYNGSRRRTPLKLQSKTGSSQTGKPSRNA